MKDITWTYESRKIDDLIENKDNPRRMSKTQAENLKRSLTTYGQCEDIVIQPDGKIIGGHQRLKTFRALGYGEVAVKVPSRELTEEEYKDLSLLLNKAVGNWDYDMLANRWELPVLLKAGFTEDELHSDIEPKQQPKKFTITLKFENEDDLRHIEGIIEPMISLLVGATMKVKVK